MLTPRELLQNALAKCMLTPRELLQNESSTKGGQATPNPLYTWSIYSPRQLPSFCKLSHVKILPCEASHTKTDTLKGAKFFHIIF